MPRNVHTSAIVLVPPAEAWAPIQAIRRRHDRQLRRWMPHVTLLYPFRPREELPAAIPALERACAAVAPFDVSLERFAFFDHGRGSFTVGGRSRSRSVTSAGSSAARRRTTCSGWSASCRSAAGGYDPGVPPPRVLLTGPPGSGKTTVIRKAVALLEGVRMAGFYTEELRGRAGRTGFRAVALDGRTARLAAVGSGGGPRVGRYTVHLEAFEGLALPLLEPSPEVELLVVDEIGKMECLSQAFVAAMRRVLAGPAALLGTVALAGGGFIAEAKQAPGVEVVEVSRESRDALPAALARRLGA